MMFFRKKTKPSNVVGTLNEEVSHNKNKSNNDSHKTETRSLDDSEVMMPGKTGFFSRSRSSTLNYIADKVNGDSASGSSSFYTRKSSDTGSVTSKAAAVNSLREVSSVVPKDLDAEKKEIVKIITSAPPSVPATATAHVAATTVPKISCNTSKPFPVKAELILSIACSGEERGVGEDQFNASSSSVINLYKKKEWAIPFFCEEQETTVTDLFHKVVGSQFQGTSSSGESDDNTSEGETCNWKRAEELGLSWLPTSNAEVNIRRSINLSKGGLKFKAYFNQVALPENQIISQIAGLNNVTLSRLNGSALHSSMEKPSIPIITFVFPLTKEQGRRGTLALRELSHSHINGKGSLSASSSSNNSCSRFNAVHPDHLSPDDLSMPRSLSVASSSLLTIAECEGECETPLTGRPHLRSNANSFSSVKLLAQRKSAAFNDPDQQSSSSNVISRPIVFFLSIIPPGQSVMNHIISSESGISPLPFIRIVLDQNDTLATLKKKFVEHPDYKAVMLDYWNNYDEDVSLDMEDLLCDPAVIEEMRFRFIDRESTASSEFKMIELFDEKQVVKTVSCVSPVQLNPRERLYLISQKADSCFKSKSGQKMKFRLGVLMDFGLYRFKQTNNEEVERFRKSMVAFRRQVARARNLEEYLLDLELVPPQNRISPTLDDDRSLQVMDHLAHYLANDHYVLIRIHFMVNGGTSKTLLAECTWTPEQIIKKFLERQPKKEKTWIISSSVDANAKAKDFILKVFGVNEFLFGNEPIVNFAYVRNCLLNSKSIMLTIVQRSSNALVCQAQMSSYELGDFRANASSSSPRSSISSGSNCNSPTLEALSAAWVKSIEVEEEYEVIEPFHLPRGLHAGIKSVTFDPASGGGILNDFEFDSSSSLEHPLAAEQSFPFISQWSILDHFKILVTSIAVQTMDSHLFIPPNSLIRVEATLYNGGVALADPLSFSVFTSDFKKKSLFLDPNSTSTNMMNSSSNASSSFSNGITPCELKKPVELDFNIKVRDIPRYARICFKVSLVANLGNSGGIVGGSQFVETITRNNSFSSSTPASRLKIAASGSSGKKTVKFLPSSSFSNVPASSFYTLFDSSGAIEILEESSEDASTDNVAGSTDASSMPVLPGGEINGWSSYLVLDSQGFMNSGSQRIFLSESGPINPIGTTAPACSSSNKCKKDCQLTLAFKVFSVKSNNGTKKPIVHPEDEPILTEENCPDLHCGISCINPTLLPAAMKAIHSDTLKELSPQIKRLIWQYRYCLREIPQALPKVLLSAKWSDLFQVLEVRRLLKVWAPLPGVEALQLLDAKFNDPFIRDYAVALLDRDMSNEELLNYLPQLVQVLKYEPYLDNTLTRFLLKRAWNNRRLGHSLFWFLKSEMHVEDNMIRYALILEAFLRGASKPVLEDFEVQNEVFTKLIKISDLVKRAKTSGERTSVLKTALEMTEFPAKFSINFGGSMGRCLVAGRLIREKCKFMDSKKLPLWLVFENGEESATLGDGSDVNKQSQPEGQPEGQVLLKKESTVSPIRVIFKNGDDLRQDMLTLQMLTLMDRIWKADGLDLKMTIYGCMSMGNELGLIEIVPDAETVSRIQMKHGGSAAAFRDEPIAEWIRAHNPKDSAYRTAVRNFTLSCAGYCVATYVLGIGDRHNDNIMITKNGHLFHIDFGHFLGNIKRKFGIKRERAPFVLTPDFVYVMKSAFYSSRAQEDEANNINNATYSNGGNGSNAYGNDPSSDATTQPDMFFELFVEMCIAAYLTIRKHGCTLISLFSMMLSTGIPELKRAEDISYLRDALSLDKDSEQEAADHFRNLIYESLRMGWSTQLNWYIHNLAHK